MKQSVFSVFDKLNFFFPDLVSMLKREQGESKSSHDFRAGRETIFCMTGYLSFQI